MSLKRKAVSSKKPPRPKKCRCGCGAMFQPRNTLHIAATPKCALAIVAKKNAKALALAEKSARLENKKRKRELESLGALLKRVERDCNEYIKQRDWGKPCFTCDRPHDLFHKRDAGHFKAVGAGGGSPARYHPNNLRMTCTQCNQHGGGGNHPLYRPRLVAEIGEDLVQAVERLHNSSIKWDRAALEQLAAWFRSESRRMKKAREASL